MTGELNDIESPEELRAELKSLLQAAHRNDIDVEGGWACRNGHTLPDWDVVVVEMQERADGD